MKSKPITLPAPIIRSLPCRQVWVPIRPQPHQSEYEPTLLSYEGRTERDQVVKGRTIPKGSRYYATTSIEEFAGMAPHPPGTLAWVQETWAHDAPDLDTCRRGVESDGPPCGPYYLVGETAPETLRWRSPVTMPRWASRWTLHIDAVAVRRLQDIASSQGVALDFREEAMEWVLGWDALYAAKGLGGVANPWCWVYTVQAIRANVADVLAGPKRWLEAT